MKRSLKTKGSRVPKLKVRELFSDKEEEWSLKLLSGGGGLDKDVKKVEINRPGLFFAGFEEYFPEDRIQLMGRGEVAFLSTKSKEEVREIAIRFMARRIPAVFVSCDQEPPLEFVEESNKMEIPIFKCSLKTDELSGELNDYLSFKLAPTTTIHGTLVDVFGVGMLLTGKSGIGKSECALDLIARGHVLVADDVIKLTHYPKGILTGSSAVKDRRLKHFIEIRGVGLVDVYSLYGIQAVRDEKRVEVHVELVEWRKGLDYERVGLVEETSEFLGVSIPYLQLPLNPGKNIATILEVIAMSYHLRVKGLSAPALFERVILEEMEKKESQ